MVETSVRDDRRNRFAHADLFSSGRFMPYHDGDSVKIRRGSLAGMRGHLVAARGEGRWLIELLDAGPGLFVCIDESAISAEFA